MKFAPDRGDLRADLRLKPLEAIRGNMGSPSLPFVRWNQCGNRVSVLWKIDKQAHPHVYDRIRCVLMGISHP